MARRGDVNARYSPGSGEGSPSATAAQALAAEEAPDTTHEYPDDDTSGTEKRLFSGYRHLVACRVSWGAGWGGGGVGGARPHHGVRGRQETSVIRGWL